MKKNSSTLKVLALVPHSRSVTKGYVGGGLVRFIEILRRGRTVGIQYIVVENSPSLKTTHNLTYDGIDVGVSSDFAAFNGVSNLSSHFRSLISMITSSILSIFYGVSLVRKNNADIILSAFERAPTVLSGFVISRLTNRPWVVPILAVPVYDNWAFFELNPSPSFKFTRLYAHHRYTKQFTITKSLFFSIFHFLGYFFLKNSIMIAINDFGEKAIKLIDNKTKIVMQFPGNAIDFKKIDLVPTHNKKYEAIFCGAIDEGKGVFDTVGAWHLVAKKVPNCQLAIIGRGTQKTVTDLKSRIQEAGLKGNISTPFDLLVGAEQEELWEYIKQAKVFIYPSLKDVFPAVVLEALACGIPVITYDSPWAVTFDKCPALIKVKMKDTNALAEQAVSIIMHHDQNKVFFENSAKQFAKQFNWDDLVLAEKRCYLKAIKEWGDRK